MSKINKKSFNLYDGNNNAIIMENSTIKKIIDKIQSSKIGGNYNIKITLKPKKEASAKKQQTINKFKDHVKKAKELQKLLPKEEKNGSYKKIMAYLMASDEKKKSYIFPNDQYKKLLVTEKKDGEIVIKSEEPKKEEIIIPKI